MSEHTEIDNLTVGFIGAGNMATALIDGLLANGWDAAQMSASDTDQSRLELLAEKGVTTCTDNQTIIENSGLIILAVKPQVMDQVLGPLEETLVDSPCLLVSIAAGISMANLQAACPIPPH